MAYRRRRWNRVARGVVKYGPRVARVASTAYKTAMAVASLVNAEYKYNDVYGNTTIGVTGSIDLITGVDGGTTDQTRNGDSVMMKYVYVKGMWQKHATATNTYVRTMIIRDMNDNDGTPPTLSQVLANTTAPQCIWSFANKDNTGRFKVLYDKVHMLDAYHTMVNLKWYHKFVMGKDKRGRPIKSAHCTWNSGTSTDTAKGHLYLITLSSETLNKPTNIYYSRFGYLDN